MFQASAEENRNTALFLKSHCLRARYKPKPQRATLKKHNPVLENHSRQEITAFLHKTRKQRETQPSLGSPSLSGRHRARQNSTGALAGQSCYLGPLVAETHSRGQCLTTLFRREKPERYFLPSPQYINPWSSQGLLFVTCDTK